jgi:hypothetical protein
MPDDTNEPSSPRKLSFFRTIKVVLWGFFGVRNANYRADLARINPVYLIVAGILAAIVFVVILVQIVRLAVSGLT